MIFSGMSIGELLDLKTKDIHFEERYMIGGLKTKAGKNRRIPINKKIEPFIKKYYNLKNEYLITDSDERKMSYTIYRRRFDNIMEILELEHNPHEARHTFASLMDSAGANKICTKKILGHALEDFTEDVYTHKTIEELIEAIDLI
jgi:integrase